MVSVASSIYRWELDEQHAYAHKPQQELKLENIRAVVQSNNTNSLQMFANQDMILALNRLILSDQSVSPKLPSESQGKTPKQQQAITIYFQNIFQ